MSPANSGPDRQRRDDVETRVGWKMAGIGMQVTSEVAAGALIGWLIDRWRGHGHLGVLIGSVCGICVGLFTLIRQSLLLNRHLDRVAPTAGRGTPIPPDPEDDAPDDDDDPLWTDRNQSDADERRGR